MDADISLFPNFFRQLPPHPNVLQLFGICLTPLSIITRYYSNGSLLKYLHSNQPLNSSMLYKILSGIAAGMLHLHKEKIVHRDLAARNILVRK